MGNCQRDSSDGEESEGGLVLIFGSPRGRPSLTRQTALAADHDTEFWVVSSLLEILMVLVILLWLQYCAQHDELLRFISMREG